MILYFSGTGNSRYVAERIAAVTGKELIDINKKIRGRDNGKIDTGKRVVIVTPTYAWRIPRIVEQWIRDTDFISAKKAWFVMTCGDEAGNAAKYNQQLCAVKQWDYMGTAQIVMPENYIAMFPVPKPSTAKKIICNAEPAIDKVVSMISKEKSMHDPKLTVTDRLKSGIVNRIFYSKVVKARLFRTTDSCIGCGKCVGLCPLNNIVLINNRPLWGKECTHCMACISYCPAGAIEYGQKSVGKPRYHFDLKSI